MPKDPSADLPPFYLEALQGSLEHLRAPLFLLDLNGDSLYANLAARELVGKALEEAGKAGWLAEVLMPPARP